MLNPNFQFNSILEVSLDFLKENKIKFIFLDVDNTIITYKGNRLIAGFKAWKDNVVNNGIKIIILSNGKTNRVKKIAEKCSLEVIGMALKPLPFKLTSCIKSLNAKPEEVLLCGDQIWTDIICAKLSGVTSVLLTPIKLEEELSFKIRRYFENKLMNKWNKK